MFYKNRPPNNRGVAHGGVAIFFKKSRLELKTFKMHNPDSYEVITLVGKISGLARKIVGIACYIPPNYPVPRGRGAMDFITQCLNQAKQKYDDPMIVLGGNFNQWDIGESMSDFVDFHEAQGVVQRGAIVVSTGSFSTSTMRWWVRSPPLETDDGSKKSGHKVLFLLASVPRAAPLEWLRYSYRYYNQESSDMFGR